ncbi:SPOR domain-containing protein, partial [bacterium]|nr:SPOR domain-containing protein [bacterium]
AEAAEGTQAQADTAASADAGSAEPASYILRFASFHQEDYAVEMLTRLSTNNVKGKIHKVSDADGTDVYQVISADEYSSLEAANAAKSDMLKIGVDAVVASSKD